LLNDPQRDTDPYIQFSADHALKIQHVFPADLQADFVRTLFSRI
jgi:hypothetical protein